MSGFHNDSHIPYIASVAVPANATSSANTGAPIRSIAQMNGLPSGSSPATTGSTKNGPNLTSTYEHYTERTTCTCHTRSGAVK